VNSPQEDRPARIEKRLSLEIAQSVQQSALRLENEVYRGASGNILLQAALIVKGGR